MAVVQTHLYNISFEQQDLMKVLFRMTKLKKDVVPQDSKKIVNKVKGVSVMDGSNPYNEPLDDLLRIFGELNIEQKVGQYHEEEIDLNEVKSMIDEVEQQYESILQIKENLETECQENKEAVILLNHLKKSNISLDDLENTHYITVRFGRLPISQVEKIKYFKDYMFIYHELHRTKNHLWLVYCGMTDKMSEIDNIFYSMGFKENVLPEFAHGKFEEAIQELDNEQTNMEKFIEEANGKLEKLANQYKDQLNQTYTIVYHLKHLYDQCQYVVDFSHKDAIYAFSDFDATQMQAKLKDIQSIQIHELPVNIYQERDIISPVILRNNRVFAPFENLLTAQIGDTFDPTTVVALSLMISAALLIGDFGVGLVLIILGYLLGKNKNHFSGILKRMGAAIFVGGLIEGSIFYSKHLYPALFTMPLDRVHLFMLFVLFNVIVVVILIIIKKLTRKTIKI